MDKRFLKYYNEELQYIRELAGEFATQYPKIAGRLALDLEGKEVCPDPFVERLLEGFAFLAARIQLKYDAEFPHFTQFLFESVYPNYLSPIPSMAVVQIEPDLNETGLAEGYRVPRGTSIRSNLGRGEKTACEYKTAHDLDLWPLRIVEAQYYTRDIGVLNLKGNPKAKAAIRIRLESTADLNFKDLAVSHLDFYIRGTDEFPVKVYEQIFAHGVECVVRSADDPTKLSETLPKDAIERVGFEENQALLPSGPRGFEGYRLLREYFNFLQRFLFFRLSGLSAVSKLAEVNRLDIILLLDNQELALEGRIDEGTFELFCTPVVNLFSKRTDRIPLSNQFPEFHVVPDKTRSLDFEVFHIEEVKGLGTRTEEQQEFRPFYMARDADKESGAFFTTKRTPRVLTAKEKKFGKSSSYLGSEIYISLVDASAAPYRSDLNQLSLVALCTNRHLPMGMTVGVGRTDFSMELGAPHVAIRCLSGPTAPQPSYAEGEIAWRIISHLSLNYLSIVDTNASEGSVALRELLKLYCNIADLESKKQIEGVRSVQSRPIVRRVETPGPIAFGRGLEISVLFDENFFEGTGTFVLGAVLERFFAKYVSINSFTETVIQSQQRGEVMRWPAKVGKRQIV